MEKEPSSIVSFVHRDAAEVVEFIKRRFSLVRIDPISKDGHISYFSRNGRLPGIDFASTTYEAGFKLTPEDKESANFFFFPDEGMVSGQSGQKIYTGDINFATHYDGNDTDSLMFYSSYRHKNAVISKSLMIERLTLLLDQPVSRKLEFAPVLDSSKGGIDVLVSLLTYILDSPFGQNISQMPFAAARMSETLTDLFLDIWPHNYSDALHRKPPSITPKHVKIAKEFIDEHPKALASTAELARLAGVSVRSLQYGFRDFLGMSISQYERRVRIDGARQAIMAGSELSVAEIATSWRFTNIYRFSQDFKVAFGMTPAELRRRIS